ncbi:MAG: alginate export family protein [Gammaproteobacteria bacterium]|jgi:hypothetical protein
MTAFIRLTSLLMIAFILTIYVSMSSAADRPSYKLLRFDENWQSFKATNTTEYDFFDPVKYIPLGKDNNVWLSMGGQVRYRGEYWQDFNFNPDNDDYFSLFNAYIHTDLHLGQNIRLFLMAKTALQEGRNLPGGRRIIDVDTIALQNAFIDFIYPFSQHSSLTLRAGRQQLLFGSRRLVDPPFWTNTRRPLDGVSAIYKTNAWTVTPFIVRPVIINKYDRNRTDDDTQFSGISLEGNLDNSISDLDMYIYRLSKNDVIINGTSGHEERYTVGAHIKGKLSQAAIDFDVETAYQFGSLGKQDINAYMVATEIGYTPEQWSLNPRFFIGLEFASGDNSLGGDVGTFNQLFPLGHASFGYIDIVGRQNIIDLREGFTFKPLKKLTVKLEGHYFWRESNSDALYNPGSVVVRSGNSGSSRNIGSEIDLAAKYKYDRHLNILLGYSKFFAGGFIEQSGFDHSVDFAYMMFEYTF